MVFYQSRLEEDAQAIKEDSDLKGILDDTVLESFPIAQELNRVRRVRQWLEQKTSEGGGAAFDYDFNLSHGLVRFLKSVGIIYIDQLRKRRNILASRPGLSKGVLEAVDQQISNLEEKLNLGVLETATPYPEVLAQFAGISEESLESAQTALPVHASTRPRPVVTESIEIRDEELRRRCLDLFAQFREDGEHQRLDTVVNEATRILEDRLRGLSGAATECTGVDLARHCFSPQVARLIVSDVQAEQEAAHLLFRGVFGFIRNSVHHRLVETLQPQRVLQIVGMVDYLISVAEGARRAT